MSAVARRRSSRLRAAAMAAETPSPRASDDAQTSIPFASALSRKGTHSLPQTIAHRGYKAKFPENTMASFRGAVAAGTHALETDIHLTADDVVVLSHDATLARCFGREEKLIDKEWAYVAGLRTLAEPHEPMPRLLDLLEWLAQPAQEDIWLLLDIKVDNDTETVMRLLGSTIASAPESKARPWHTRIVLGLWSVNFLPYAEKYLPSFPIAHIGFSLTYASQFFAVPGAGFNMLFDILLRPGSGKFLRKAKAARRPVFAWTVDDPVKMRWCIRKRLDGVVTDDPALFNKVGDEYDDASPAEWLSVTEMCKTVRMWVMVLVFGRLFYKKIDKRKPVLVEGGNTQAGDMGP